MIQDLPWRMNVTGDLSPAVNGCYADFPRPGTLNAWHDSTSGYYVWYSSFTHRTYLADTYPTAPTGTDKHWYRFALGETGRFLPAGGATGDAYCFYVKSGGVVPTTWDDWGRERKWLVRSGAHKAMPGQQFIARCNIPPRYAKCPAFDNPEPERTIPHCFKLYLIYDPLPNEAILHIYSDTDEYFGSHGGLSIFEINPRAAGKHWERKHTRIVKAVPNWGTSNTGAEYWFKPHWPSTDAYDVRVFARGWHGSAFKHYGPLQSAPFPP